ncbi:hypothetical protein BDP55DRAFT_624850 [Colletotrichum godetiae]|uniref:Tyrosinase copper-binding domain-containing protein n=1 Tax=Colletotrichum godetiae TaxID=1209918 RepID=A0AAJ0A571_9PEZI|nr:uncharacterized protein BDP55DRAFT_624850 [Colletotrichum godetiae]KAK1656697.1 hypothetical protein BDP55DRAFT_624850 [Colletotrichum godetiae]
MHFLHLSILFGLAASAVTRQEHRCIEPATRVEWRDLEPELQQSYIDAVLCLKTKPSRLGFNTSLYDDFPYVHQKYNKIIHGIAGFLPWHRYFGQVYEDALRECGYKGVATYWDWTLDVMKFAESPVMSPTLGFGYDGSDSRTETLSTGQKIRCVDSGPFSELRPSYIAINPTTTIQEEHCLFRSLSDGNTANSRISAENYNATSIEIVQSEKTFETYRPMLEGGPHGIIHSSLGGEMNPTTSPNEPLFFLHHAQIDRLWWKWQQESPSTREFEYSGLAAQINSTELIPAHLDDMLLMGGLAEDLRVQDVMTTNGRLCYVY